LLFRRLNELYHDIHFWFLSIHLLSQVGFNSLYLYYYFYKTKTVFSYHLSFLRTVGC